VELGVFDLVSSCYHTVFVEVKMIIKTNMVTIISGEGAVIHPISNSVLCWNNLKLTRDAILFTLFASEK